MVLALVSVAWSGDSLYDFLSLPYIRDIVWNFLIYLSRRIHRDFFFISKGNSDYLDSDRLEGLNVEDADYFPNWRVLRIAGH